MLNVGTPTEKKTASFFVQSKESEKQNAPEANKPSVREEEAREPLLNDAPVPSGFARDLKLRFTYFMIRSAAGLAVRSCATWLVSNLEIGEANEATRLHAPIEVVSKLISENTANEEKDLSRALASYVSDMKKNEGFQYLASIHAGLKDAVDKGRGTEIIALLASITDVEYQLCIARIFLRYAVWESRNASAEALITFVDSLQNEKSVHILNDALRVATYQGNSEICWSLIKNQCNMDYQFRECFRWAFTNGKKQFLLELIATMVENKRETIKTVISHICTIYNRNSPVSRYLQRSDKEETLEFLLRELRTLIDSELGANNLYRVIAKNCKDIQTFKSITQCACNAGYKLTCNKCVNTVSKAAYSSFDDWVNETRITKHLHKLEPKVYAITFDNKDYGQMDYRLFDCDPASNEIAIIETNSIERIATRLERMNAAKTSKEFRREYIWLRGSIIKSLMAEHKKAKDLAGLFFNSTASTRDNVSPIDLEKLYLVDEKGMRIACDSTIDLMAFQMQLFRFMAISALETLKNDLSVKKKDRKQAAALLKAMNKDVASVPFQLNLVSNSTMAAYTAEVRSFPEKEEQVLQKFDEAIAKTIDSNFLENENLPELLRTWIINTIQDARKSIQQAAWAANRRNSTVH